MDIVEKNNQLVEDNAKKEDLEFFPLLSDRDLLPSQKKKVSYTKLAGMGKGAKTLGQSLKKFVEKEATSGLYEVTVASGQSLAKFQDGSGYIGTSLGQSGQIAGQARLNKIILEPEAMIVSAILYEIGEKMDRIIELQEEILNFLIAKDKSELKSDLFFLEETMKTLQHNWDNQEYRRVYLNKALDIKHRSNDKIIFYRGQLDKNTKNIKRELSRSLALSRDKKIIKLRDKSQNYLADYKLSLYTYSFASFIEVLLLENYNKDYLENILDNLYQVSINYKAQHSYNQTLMESYSKTGLQYKLSKGLARGSEAASSQINKIPVLKEREPFEKLGNFFEKDSSKRIESIMEPLEDQETAFVKPFVDNIRTMREIQNNPLTLYFDEEGVYF